MKTFLNGKILFATHGISFYTNLDCLEVDGVTSLLLAMEAEGLLPASEDPRMNAALQTTIDAIANNQ